MTTILAPGLSGPGTRYRALEQIGRTFSPGWCLYWVTRHVFKVPGLGDYDHDGAADAEDYWKAAVKRGKVVKTSDPKKIPAGVMVMWTGGSGDHGHAAYSLGNGQMVSTDLPTRGKIGRVPIDLARKQWGLKLVGYILVDGNGFTLTHEDQPQDDDWFKLLLVNHAAASDALDTKAAKEKWDERRDDLVNNVLDVKAHVIVGLECGGTTPPNPWHYLSTKYAEHGYELVPGGGEGRHLWRAPKAVAAPIATGSIDTPTVLRNARNNVPAPWMIAEIDGAPGMVVGFHLDYRATDNQRVKLALFIIDEATKIAAPHGIGPSRIVFAGDAASDNWVRDRAFEERKYSDAFDVAAKAVNKQIKSYNRYQSAVPGPRVSGIYVYRGDGPGKGDNHARPVRVVSQRLDSFATNHHLMAGVIGRQEE